MTGISFLSPVYLLGAISLIVPLLIHLFSKRSARVRQFSDIRFIREAVTRRSRQIHLEERRLLLLRMALLAILVLALAKPVVKLSPAGIAGEGQRTSLALVVDSSLSMGAADNAIIRMDRARDRIQKDILPLYGPDDEITVVLACEYSEVVFRRVPPSLPEVESELARLKPSHLASDLAEGISLAVSALEEAEDMKREIFILSDMQVLAWKNVLYTKSEAGEKDIDCFLIPLGLPGAKNSCVTGMRVDSLEEAQGRRKLAVTFRIETFGSEPDPAPTLREVINGREEGSSIVRPAVGRPAELSFTNLIREEGPIHGHVELSRDSLPGDNNYHFLLGGGEEGRILVVGPSEKQSGKTVPGGTYLMAALDAMKHQTGIEVRREDWDDPLSLAALEPYDLVILVDVPRLSEASSGVLRAHLDRGRSILFFLGSHIIPEAYNRTLFPDVLPLRIKPEPYHVPTGRGRISRRAVDHPALEVFDRERIDLSPPLVWSHWILQDVDNARPIALLGLDDVYPLLVEAKIGKGKVVAFTCSIGDEWTDLSKHEVFVILLSELVKYLTAGENRNPPRFVGDSVLLRLVAPQAGQGIGRVNVTHPNGERSALEIPFTHGGAVYFFTRTLEPGRYRFDPSSEGAEVSVSPREVALNLKPAESDLSRVSVEAARNRLSAFRLAPPPRRGAVKDMVRKAREGRPIWDYLLMLALVLLAVETLYGNRLRTLR